MYTNYAYRRGRGVKVGDVVDFHHPMVPGSGAVKRVVGMPGDFVARGGEGGTGGMMMQVRGSLSGRLEADGAEVAGTR